MRFFKTVFIVLLSTALNINNVLAFNNAVAFEKGVTPSSCAAEEAALVSLVDSGINGLISGQFNGGQAFENAAIAALTAALSTGVGDLKGALKIFPGNFLDGNFNPVATLESALLHGAVGCVGSSLSGQSCGSGFVSGSISDLANVVSTGNTASDLLLHAVIGGTASQLSGGDFATGALNASLAELFNDLSNHSAALALGGAGAVVGGAVAGGACVVTTYGACAPVSPLVVGAGAGAGALAGGLLGNAIDWLESLALGQLTANNNANDNPPGIGHNNPPDDTNQNTQPPQPPIDPNTGLPLVAGAYIAQQNNNNQLATQMGILREAALGLQNAIPGGTPYNFNLGSATQEQAMQLGEAWVGPNYTVASDGTTLVSQDGLRQFRPPSIKDSSFATTGIQANFQSRFTSTGIWNSNGHLNIIQK